MGKLIRFRRQAKEKGKDEAARALFPPFLSPTDARATSYPTDAASALGPGAAPDPVIQRRMVRNQRTLIVGLVALFLACTAAALFGDRGYLDVARQERQYRELRDIHEAHQQRVEALRRDIERLRTDPAALERIAREDLGYAAPNELTLLLPGDEPGEPARLDAKTGSGIVPAVRNTP